MPYVRVVSPLTLPGGWFARCDSVPIDQVSQWTERPVASKDECQEALRELAGRLAGNNANGGPRINLDRSIACTLRDLGISYHGRLRNGEIEGLAEGDDPSAKIRLTATSDDLVAMVKGELDFAKAWASGRLSVRANPLDLLKVRGLL